MSFFLTYSLYAQDSAQTSFGINYATEIQTNFGEKYNWVNLLSLSAELPTEKISKKWKNGSFQIETISIFKIFEERIVEDLMTFSNIEEENMLINLFLLGYTHQWEKISLFGGVRNVNNDYFIMPYTSLFTNSSAGIFPTLSINFPLANYPLSGVCLHFEYEPTEKLFFKSSLYNGVARDPRKNPLYSFTLNPSNDGISSISELSYTQNKFGSGMYSLGIALHAFGKQVNSTYSIFGMIEQTIFNSEQKEIGFVIQGGFAPSAKNECSYYFATGGYFAGLLTKQKQDKLGIYLNATEVSGIREQTLEITYQYPICKKLYVQPALHYIVTGNEISVIGLCRFIFAVFD